MGRLMLGLMALVVWGGLIGHTDGSRKLAQLPQPSATDCQFPDSNSGLVSNSYLPDYLLVTPAAALRCFNTIQLDYTSISGGIRALADMFERTYAFVAIAADPAGTPQSNPFNFKVFDQKVDIPKELRALTDGLPQGAPAPLGDVFFTINELFNRLRDAHVTYSGSGTAFGGVVAAMAATSSGGAQAYLVEPQSSAYLNSIKISANNDGTLSYFFTYQYPSQDLVSVPVTAIDGSDPMNTLIKWANSPVFSWYVKALGARINGLLGQMGSLDINSLGRPTGLTDVLVDYGNGTTSTHSWAISMLPNLMDGDLANYQTQANTPGLPAQALAQFISVYDNETMQPAPPLASASRSLKASRPRRAQAITPGASFTTLSTSADNQQYGLYYFNGTRATLKLTSFEFTTTDIAQWWPGFIAAAKTQGATDLVLDLTGNGGGRIFSGVALALALYPTASAGDLGMTYDRIIGPEALYAYQMGLTPTALNSRYQTFTSNDATLQARAMAINTNATELSRLSQLTLGSFDAVTALFTTSTTGQLRACTNVTTGDEMDCGALWTALTSSLQADLQSVLAGNISTARLASLLTVDFSQLLQSFWPYGGATNSSAADEYANPMVYSRGGYSRSYTGRYTQVDDTDTASDFFQNIDSNPPFQNILVVGDGLCGSTCDTFSKAAWFYSMANPSQPKFKYATFGGTGKIEDSTGSSFPGGNVNGDDLVTQAWAYEAVAYLQAVWAGDDSMAQVVSTYMSYLPALPSFLDKSTPRYTQSEIYRKAMGPNALPMEYYLIPPDYQINAWYRDTGLPTDPTAGLSADLQSLYSAADNILLGMH